MPAIKCTINKITFYLHVEFNIGFIISVEVCVGFIIRIKAVLTMNIKQKIGAAIFGNLMEFLAAKFNTVRKIFNAKPCLFF